MCDFCNPTIRLNSQVAACFSERVDGELVRLAAEGRGFVLVDLTQCVETKSRGLPKAPGPIDAVDTSFVADEASLRCLSAEIVRLASTLDPSVEIDLTKCP